MIGGRRSLAAAVATAVIAAAAVIALGAPAVVAAEATSRFVPVAPTRLADTRETGCGCTRVSGDTIRVVVAGRAPVPAGAVAAALTITTDASTAPGFASVYPTGTPRPTSSTVNFAGADPVANSTIVRLGDGGAVDVFALHPTQLIVDVTGVFVAAGRATAGRFVPLAPTRLLDTREGAGALAPGGSVTVPLPTSVAPDATGVAVNVTSVEQHQPGFVTGSAAGTPRPDTSLLNLVGDGAARSSSVVLPASPAGITLTTTAGGQLVVDIVGWFTGPSAVESTDGLFVPVDPQRLLDTRDDHPRLWPDGTRELAAPVAGAAVVTNVTLDRADGAGFVSAFPAGTPTPVASSINAPGRDRIVANLAITPLSTRGTAYHANRGVDLIVDLTGWFTGAPAPAPLPPAPNEMPDQRVLLVGDSTLGTLVFLPQTHRALQGFTAVVDAHPCRRLVVRSCVSPSTGEQPNTALQAIQTAPGTFDGVVIKVGYNDGAAGFADAVEQIRAAALDKGARWVLWLTYAEGPNTQNGSYQLNNATLRRLAAVHDDLIVADWRSYAAPSVGWYIADRVHLTGLGGWATADYISRWVAAIAHAPCPVPWAPGAADPDPCPDPDDVGAPDVRALYGV